MKLFVPNSIKNYPELEKKYRLISHRGNVDGKYPQYENLPEYVDKALNLGYDVEVDLWIDNDGYAVIIDGEPLTNNRAFVELIWGIKTSGLKFETAEA